MTLTWMHVTMTAVVGCLVLGFLLICRDWD